MALSAEKKATVIQEAVQAAGFSAQDVGSPEVQVSLLTADILELTQHFKQHHKDEHSRRGLRKKVSMRRKLLDYLKAKDVGRYQALIQRLGLRR